MKNRFLTDIKLWMCLLLVAVGSILIGVETFVSQVIGSIIISFSSLYIGILCERFEIKSKEGEK